MNDDELQIDETLIAINNMASETSDNKKALSEIKESIDSIESHITNIDEIISLNQENGIDEQETEKVDKQEKEETGEQKESKSESKSESEEAEEIDLSDIHTEIQQVNENLTLTNQILTGTILFLGVIVGVMLFKIVWDRLKK